MFSFKKKESNQSLENGNKSFIIKRVNGLKSVALLSAVVFTMLSGCVSDKEYEEVKMENEELSAQYSEYLETISSIYREYDEKYEEAKMKNEELSAQYSEYSEAISSIYREYEDEVFKYKYESIANDDKCKEDMKNFIEEYKSYCQETSFDFEDYQQYVCNGYKTKLNEYVAYFEHYLKYGMGTVNYSDLEAKLDDAQETFGKLKGYVNTINTEKNAKGNSLEEYELGLE